MHIFFYMTFLLLATSLTHANPDLGEQMLLEAYGEEAVTLYCQRSFTPGDRTSLDGAYNNHELRNHFNCRTQRQCESVPGYLEVSNDLHNLFPVSRQVELDRRRRLYADLGSVAEPDPDCGYRMAFQNIEPPEHAKGPIARAILYMHEHHKLPLRGSLELYQRWNRLNPVTELEQRRNDVIEQLQGNRNPFIDDPERANSLRSQSPLQLQFGG